MRQMRWITTAAACMVLTGVAAIAAAQEAAEETAPAPKKAEGPQPYRAPAAPAKAEMRGIKLDREAGHIDLDAKVVLREGEWLELLACTPGTREHESILTVEAQPRNIHLALILLGLEPGSPLKWQRLDDGEVKVHPPTGPKVTISLIYEQDDQIRTVDANQWIVDQQTGRVMPDNVWLFAGSRFETFDGKQVYMADPNGSVISIVNFGDDVLARDTQMTRDNDEQSWDANTPVIPKEGTAVTIRIKPVEVEEDETDEGVKG